MNAEDSRRPAAHETLNQIADRLNALSAQSGDGDTLSPYATRLPPAHANAATPDPSSQADVMQPAEQSAVATQPTLYATQSEPPIEEAAWPDFAADPAQAAPGRTSQAAFAAHSEAPAPAPTPLVIAQPEARVRTALLTYFPMLIAIMSLAMSIFQGYLFHRSIDLSQRSIDLLERNVARGEYIRTCREVIETYFQVKQKVSVLMPAADRGNVAGASRVTEANRLDAQAAIAKFGGLGTYLANFQDPGTRARYTELTRTLNGIFENARATPLADIDKVFEPADKLFTSMNDDCVRLARTMRL